MLDFEELEKISARVEHALPPDVLSDLRREGFSLTLGSSSPGTAFRPVIVDPSLAEQVAERELVGEMDSYRKDVTGVDNTVFISAKGHVRHAARIKLAIDPPQSINPLGKTASVAIHNGNVIAGEAAPSAELLRQARLFIEINRDVLIDYWEYRIDTEELRRRLRSI